MRTILSTATINQSPRDVFEMLADPECDSRWMVGVVGTDRLTLGDMRQGTAMVCKFGIGPLITMKANAVIEEFEPGRRFVRRRVGGALAMKGEFAVEPDGTGSIVRWTMEVGLHARSMGMLFDPLIARWMKMSIEISLRKLKALAESQRRLPVKELQNA